MSRVPRYERYLFDPGAGTDVVFSGFTDSEWRCYFGGVLVVAAKSPIRGWLLVTEKVAATPEDMAKVAGVRPRVGRATIEKARSRGLVEHDSDVSCDRVVDFDKHNPPPKADSTNAERQRRYRDRQRKLAESNGVTAPLVTEPVTAGIEEKGIEEKDVKRYAERIARIQEIFQRSDLSIDEVSVLNALERFPELDHEQLAMGCAEWCRTHGRPPGLTFHRFLQNEARDLAETRDREEHTPTHAGMNARDTCKDCGVPIKTGKRCRECDLKLEERNTGAAA